MRRRKRAGARPPTRLSPGAAARQGPIPEDFSGELLPSRSPNRPVRSRWHSRRSDIMPFSLEISQTRYTVPGLRRVGRPCAGASRRRTAAHARAASHTTSSASGAGRRVVPRATVPPPLRQHRQPLASLAAPDGLAAAAAARPPQATRARARERPRGVPSRGADSTPPPAVARDRGATSRTATSSSSWAASSTSAARSGPRKWPPQSVRRGRRDQLGDIHLGDRRRAQCARTTSPSADEPTRSARARVDASTAAACCANRG